MNTFIVFIAYIHMYVRIFCVCCIQQEALLHLKTVIKLKKEAFGDFSAEVRMYIHMYVGHVFRCMLEIHTYVHVLSIVHLCAYLCTFLCPFDFAV